MSSLHQDAAQVWRELHADLLRFIRRRISDLDVADDLLQEVFLRIHDRLTSLRHPERLHAWVYQIARNTIVEHFRSRSRAAGEPVDREPAIELAEDDNLNSEVAGWLREMVDRLPDVYREAVRLAELEALPQKEVASRLGLTVSGAKSRIQRGRQMLNRELLACCHLEWDKRGNVVDYSRRRACDYCGR